MSRARDLWLHLLEAHDLLRDTSLVTGDPGPWESKLDDWEERLKELSAGPEFVVDEPEDEVLNAPPLGEPEAMVRGRQDTLKLVPNVQPDGPLKDCLLVAFWARPKGWAQDTHLSKMWWGYGGEHPSGAKKLLRPEGPNRLFAGYESAIVAPGYHLAWKPDEYVILNGIADCQAWMLGDRRAQVLHQNLRIWAAFVPPNDWSAP